MTNEEIERSVSAFNNHFPEGIPVKFKELKAGQKFRHPKALRHKLLHVIFSCPEYIKYTKDDWKTTVTPSDELWNATVQTFE